MSRRSNDLVTSLQRARRRFVKMLKPHRALLTAPMWIVGTVLDRSMHAIGRTVAAVCIWVARRIFRLPLLAFRRVIAWFDQSSSQWRSRINLRYLLQGLPAVLVMFAMAIPLVARDKGKNLGTYEIEAQTALRGGEYERAELLYRALVQTEPDADEYRFRLALANQGLGRHQIAATMMAELAPENAPGNAAAHYWQAERLMTDLLDAETAKHIENHLRLALQAKSNYPEAQGKLGEFYLLTGQLDKAEEHLLAGTDENPALWIQLARLHVLQGKPVEAQADGQRALEHFKQKAEADLDDANSRLLWAESLVFLDRYDDAARVLSDGVKMSDDPRYSQALGRVFFKWSELLRSQPNVNPLHLYELLVRAYTSSPDNPLLLRRMIQGLRSRGDDAKLVRSVIRTLLDREQSLAILNLLLAIDADFRKQPEEAAEYLAKAAAIDSRAPSIIARMSMTFVEYPPMQYQQAIDVVNLGLSAWPEQTDLLYQRGLVRFRKGSYAEAMVDLNAVAAKRPGDFRAHFLLAKLYQNFGMQEQADKHRALARAPD
jgi:tetratricopeptide (TPR) repeat protein